MLAYYMEFLKSQPQWILLLFSLGTFILLKHTLSLLRWAFICLCRTPKDLESYGPWALVTGSTDGIGRAFAFELARKGLNLILVSKSKSKLESVSNEIKSKYPSTDVKVVVLDFDGDDVVEVVKAAVEGVAVGVLVNNVGVSYAAARYFDEVPEKEWMKVVRVNLEGTTKVTRVVLGGMIRRRKGAIVNIGSGASNVVPSHPLFAVYAATKAYVNQFSRCLYAEYKHFGIDIQCQVPLYVSTKMASQVASIEKSSFFIPTPEDYAKSAIQRIGFEWRCTPYWTHSVQWFLASLLPEFVLDRWRLDIGIKRREMSLGKKVIATTNQQANSRNFTFNIASFFFFIITFNIALFKS